MKLWSLFVLWSAPGMDLFLLHRESGRQREPTEGFVPVRTEALAVPNHSNQTKSTPNQNMCSTIFETGTLKKLF